MRIDVVVSLREATPVKQKCLLDEMCLFNGRLLRRQRTRSATRNDMHMQLFSISCVKIVENKGVKMNNNYKQLTRSKSNRMIAGVCAGLGEYLGIDPTIVRLLFVLGFFMGLHGGIVLIYLIMAIVTPEEIVTQ